MKVLVCGSRNWEDHSLVWSILQGIYEEQLICYMVVDLESFMLIEGGAKGADRAAQDWAKHSPLHQPLQSFFEYEPGSAPDRQPFFLKTVEANWTEHGRAAGPYRNREMLAENPDLVIAFKDDFDRTLSKGGTEHMVKIAKKAGVKTVLVSHV